MSIDNPDRRTFVKGIAGAAIGAAAFNVLGDNQAFAETSANEAGKLGFKASDWANNGQGIGMVALIGKELKDAGWDVNGAGEEVAQRIRAAHGVTVQPFIGDNGDNPSSFTFFTAVKDFGPFNIEQALNKQNTAQISDQFLKEKQHASLELAQD